MSIKRLPKQVFSSILSNSSINSQASVIKELVENSIDALVGSTNGQINVEIDSRSAGLAHIVVSDNGCGVPKDGRALMCLNCTTSKLRTIDDLNHGITTCGFRGEALYLISQLSQKMQIVTRTTEDDICEVWDVNDAGIPSAVPEKKAGPIGTSVKLQQLFFNTPVRKQFLQKHSRGQMEKIRKMIIGYAFAHRNIRFQFKVLDINFSGNICSIIDQMMIPAKFSPLQMAGNVLKLRKKESLFELNESVNISDPNSEDHYKVHISGVLPRMRAQDEVASNRRLKVLLVNHRLLSLNLKFGRAISHALNEVYDHCMLLKPQAWFLKLDIPPEMVDVNIEPSKDDIMIPAEAILLTDVFKCLTKIVEKECSVTEEQLGSSITLDSLNSPLNTDNLGLKIRTITSPDKAVLPDSNTKSLFVSDVADHSVKYNNGEAVVLVKPSGDEATSTNSSSQEIPIEVSEGLTSPSTSQPLPIHKTLKRMPLLSEMGQHTLGLEKHLLFAPSRNKDYRNNVIWKESGWTSRVGIPTQLLQLGFVEILKKKGYEVSINSLKTELNKDGIFKVEF